jgi:hypothetical protein
MLFILNCKTTPPLQFKENKQGLPSLIVVGSDSRTTHTVQGDIHEDETTYMDMNEETFMELLKARLDTLSIIEGIWSNDQNTYRVGIEKAGDEGKYTAFILHSDEPSLKKGDIIAGFFETRYGDIFSTIYYLEDTKKIETKSYVHDQGKLGQGILKLYIYLIELNKGSITLLKDFPQPEDY